jgi:hypothetical protein
VRPVPFEADTGQHTASVGEQAISYAYRLAGTGRFSTTGRFVEAEADLDGSLTIADRPPFLIAAHYGLTHR